MNIMVFCGCWRKNTKNHIVSQDTKRTSRSYIQSRRKEKFNLLGFCPTCGSDQIEEHKDFVPILILDTCFFERIDTINEENQIWYLSSFELFSLSNGRREVSSSINWNFFFQSLNIQDINFFMEKIKNYSNKIHQLILWNALLIKRGTSSIANIFQLMKRIQVSLSEKSKKPNWS